jgi:hypothetical protein
MANNIWDITLTLNLQRPVKKHFSKQSQTTSHHCGFSGHIRPHCPKIHSQKPRIRKQEPKTGKSSSKPSKPHHASQQKRQYPQRGSPSCRRSVKNGHTKADASDWSLTSPRKFKSMKACLHDEECPSLFGQIGHGLQPYLTCKEGMSKEGWDYSPLERERTRLVGEVSPCLRFWFLNLIACKVRLQCIVYHVISYSCLTFY